MRGEIKPGRLSGPLFRFCARWVLVAALAAALAACDIQTLLYGDTSSAAPVAAPVSTNGKMADFTVDLGTGELAFELLTDGEMVDKVEGPQGGYHVWASLHLDGTVPETVIVELVVTTGSGELVSRASEYREPKPDPPPGTRWSIVGQRAFVESFTTGVIVIRANVVDPATKASASAERHLVLR
jgi:hypothetical protein